MKFSDLPINCTCCIEGIWDVLYRKILYKGVPSLQLEGGKILFGDQHNVERLNTYYDWKILKSKHKRIRHHSKHRARKV